MDVVKKCIPCFNNAKGQAHNEGRYVYANKPEDNKAFGFVDNHIKTSKYNFVTFLPINLFEQFRKAANLYFLLQIIIMCIPQITALQPMSTAVPLIIIMLVTMVKDGYDDYGRHASDNRLNNQQASVLDINGKMISTKWQDVHTGDIIKVVNDEPVTADIVVLSTSEESGLCFIETAELDGETNLKVRQPPTVTADTYANNEDAYRNFDAKVICEPPNNRLDKFQGNLDWQSQTHSLDNNNVILRGCVLRNTPFVYGLVVYAGHDSKLMMNSGKGVFKRTKLDYLTNKLVIWIAILLGVICAFCSLMSYFWERSTGKSFQYILPWESFYNNSPGMIALINWPGFVMILNTLIPISLYISIEVIRLGQSLLINWDVKIYHQESDTPAVARNTTLTEELGQIQYIFSDKTGTLTENVMEFKECSINGKVYGHVEDVEDGISTELTSIREDESVTVNPSNQIKYVDFSSNKYADPEFKFNDHKLVESIQNNEEDTVEFFRLLALCHTVMVEDKKDDSTDGDDGSGINTLLEYQAQSPDEGALVSAARNFGLIFKSRTPNTITIEYAGIEETYDILCILDFDNVRKRMSVIVKRDDKITLYCKGADTIMAELLTKGSMDIKGKTEKDLELFAQSGLRTLMLASKDMTQPEYDSWLKTFEDASQSMEDRDEKVMKTFVAVEQGLNLLGATAIEDKLQDGVPEAIANLALANINIWILTGDKQETAINIGYSSYLLTEEMIDVFIIDGEDMKQVTEQIHGYLSDVEKRKPEESGPNKLNVPVKDKGSGSITSEDKEGYGLVIPGKSLAFALQEEDDLNLKFLQLAKSCKAVICCRVTPLQKALVVELVKRNVNATTLSIGDGANDVSMIKAAHIGVGISGKEGRQAVLAADYSFAQFKYLERLLLVHGRWSYWRMSKFLNYFFYKNFAFTLVQFWFTLFCGFSAQTLYDTWYISVYNVCFTSLPVLAMGILDQDVNDEMCLKAPKLYAPGQQNILFNQRTFISKLIHGTITSCLMFFIPYGIYQDVIDSDGITHSDLTFFGVAVGSTLVIIVNLQMALDTSHWTWINHFFIWGSIVFYFLYTFTIYSETIYNYLPNTFTGVGDAVATFGFGNFWASLFLTAAICIPPVMAYRWVMIKFRPTLSDEIRKGDQTNFFQRAAATAAAVIAGKRRRSKVSRRRSYSTRSSYAFSQEKGFGALFMKKHWLKKIGRSSDSYDLPVPAPACAGENSRNSKASTNPHIRKSELNSVTSVNTNTNQKHSRNNTKTGEYPDKKEIHIEMKDSSSHGVTYRSASSENEKNGVTTDPHGKYQQQVTLV